MGQRTGEFCAQDRAMLFEDPTGVRILYDPGNTVAGAGDPRLGAVDLILISHAHSDHLGNAKLEPGSQLEQRELQQRRHAAGAQQQYR